MASINPHINFNGNAEEAFHFYQSIFGGEFTKIIRFKDIASDEYPVAENEAAKIMHITLSFGSNKLMANDVPASMGQVSEQENRSKIYINAESREEATRFFNDLSKNGTIEVPLVDTHGDSCFAMFRDKFGIEWIIDFTSTNS